jgi:hypothetical protein
MTSREALSSSVAVWYRLGVSNFAYKPTPEEGPPEWATFGGHGKVGVSHIPFDLGAS